MPPDTSDWQPTSAFLRNQGEIAGLPAKRVHIDSEGIVPNDQETGQLYEGQEPPVSPRCTWSKAHCFRCQTPLTGMGNARPYFTRRIADSSGKSRTAALPACPIPDLEIKYHDAMPHIAYTLEPCGCTVDDHDMSSLRAIAEGRASGRASRHGDLAKLSFALDKLYQAQPTAFADTKRDIDYWIAAVIGTIRRLKETDDFSNWPPMPLEPEVVSWANESGLQVTPFLTAVNDDPVDYLPDYPMPAGMGQAAEPVSEVDLLGGLRAIVNASYTITPPVPRVEIVGEDPGESLLNMYQAAASKAAGQAPPRPGRTRSPWPTPFLRAAVEALTTSADQIIALLSTVSNDRRLNTVKVAATRSFLNAYLANHRVWSDAPESTHTILEALDGLMKASGPRPTPVADPVPSRHTRPKRRILRELKD